MLNSSNPIKYLRHQNLRVAFNSRVIKIDLSFLNDCSYALIPAICICEHFWFASSIWRIIYGILLELVEIFNGIQTLCNKGSQWPDGENKENVYTPVFLFVENVIQAVK